MTANNVDGYLRWITPGQGDPTYSLLKAHLLFEELLRAYLARTLPHASALEGARLTFVQLLAVARASSTHVQPNLWIWKAFGDLNKLRNMLSHEARPSAMAERMDAYTKFVVESMKVPLPDFPFVSKEAKAILPGSHLFSAVDMVTLGLYYHSAALLGFNVQAIAERSKKDAGETGHQSTTSLRGGDSG